MIEADARSFTAQELAARLRPFVKRRVSDGDVEDVLQEIFLRIHRGLPGLRDEERFGPWVYRVARSAVADNGRARSRAPLAGSPAEEVSSVSAEDDGAAERLAGAVALFVTLLPSPYREAIVMTELQGMPQREAAALLGVSITAMKSRVRRGLAQLRALLEACCEIALDARGHVVAFRCRDGTKCKGRSEASEARDGGSNSDEHRLDCKAAAPGDAAAQGQSDNQRQGRKNTEWRTFAE